MKKLYIILTLIMILSITACIDERHELQIAGVVDMEVSEGECKSYSDPVYKTSGIIDLAQYLTRYNNFNYDYILNLYVRNNQLIDKDKSDLDTELKKAVTITSADIVLTKGKVRKSLRMVQEEFVVSSKVGIYEIHLRDILRPILIDTMDEVVEFAPNNDETLYEYLQFKDDDDNYLGILDRRKLLAIALKDDGTPDSKLSSALNIIGETAIQKLWEEFETGREKGHYLTVEVTLHGKRADGTLLTSNKFKYRIEVVSTELFYVHIGTVSAYDYACNATCFSTYQDYSRTCGKE